MSSYVSKYVFLSDAIALIRTWGATEPEAELYQALEDGALPAWGDVWSPEEGRFVRREIPADVWAEAFFTGFIDRDLLWLATDPVGAPPPPIFVDDEGAVRNNPEYAHMLRTEREALERLWRPAEPAGAGGGPAAAAPPPAPAPPVRNPGGRPPKWDRLKIAAEVIRIAHMDELGSRAELYRKIAEFCQSEFGAEPAPSTLRDILTSLLSRVTLQG